MMFKQVAMAAMVATAALATSAYAAPVNGTDSGSIRVAGPTAELIGLNTVFTFTSGRFGDGTGDLLAIPFEEPFITITGVTATVGSMFSFTSAYGNFDGSVVRVSAPVAGPSRKVLIDILGDFNPDGGLSSFDTGAMSMTLTINQTILPGATNNAISSSFTIASPPVRLTEVPEPGALALVGIALAGLALIRRKA